MHSQVTAKNVEDPFYGTQCTTTFMFIAVVILFMHAHIYTVSQKDKTP